MGQSVSAKAKELQQAQLEAEREMKEDLAQMSVILDAKEEQFKAKLITPNTADKTIPVDTIIKMQSEKTVDVSTGPSDKLNEMVEDLFGGNFLKSLKGLILGALDSVLGNATAGEKTKVGMTVLLLHSAVVRVDYFVYAYTMRSDGIVTRLQNGMCFVATLSTVKLSKVNSEAIALLSGITAEQSMAFMNRLRRLFERIVYNIGRNDRHYSVGEAIGLMQGYFGSSLSDADRTRISGFATPDGTLSDAATDDDVVWCNTTLLSLATANAVEKSDSEMIHKKQQELLEAMIEIYDKIREMKVSTSKSIKEAQGDNF